MILLLDLGLLNRHGHHFHTDLGIQDVCRARGPALSILGNRAVEPTIRAALPVAAAFEATAYPSPDGTAERDLRTDFDTFNALVERDLHRAVDHRLGTDDLILVPTALGRQARRRVSELFSNERYVAEVREAITSCL